MARHQTILDQLKPIAARYTLSIEDVLGKRRDALTKLARNACYYYAWINLDKSYSAVARVFNKASVQAVRKGIESHMKLLEDEENED